MPGMQELQAWQEVRLRDPEVHRIRHADHRADEAVVREADHDRSMQAKEAEVDGSYIHNGDRGRAGTYRNAHHR